MRPSTRQRPTRQPALRQRSPRPVAQAGTRQPDGSPEAVPSPEAASREPSARVAVFGTDGNLIALSSERQEFLCSVIGLSVKLGLVALAGVSLFRLAGAYQSRMERQGELAAVLELESAKLARARERFDLLFMTEGEQRLIREQHQWIAPNRLRVVWHEGDAFPSVERADAGGGTERTRP